MVLRCVASALALSAIGLSPAVYGVERSAIQAAIDRYKVVGVISEESPRKPLAGIAVLKDLRTSETLTLTIGDPLPNDTALSIVSTKSGQVVISSGQEEFTLQHSEAVVEPSRDDSQPGFDELSGKWEDNISVLGKASALSKDKRLLPDGDLGTVGRTGGVAGSTVEDKMRFPYYKVDNALGDGDGERESAFDPFTEIDSFSQDWDWIPASDLSLYNPDVSDPEAPRILENTPLSPWWVGEDEELASAKMDP